MQRPKRIITVLGMHRSGTSCLTGSLQACGLELGKYYDSNPYNKKGNRENQDIIDLHEQLLAYNNASWDNPPIQCRWSKTHAESARNIVSGYADLPIWGFKDPRTILALAGWEKIIPDLVLVGIFRHPLAVARSLASRDGISQEQGLKIWQVYNGAMLAWLRKKPFPLLCFDEPEERFLESVELVVAKLGLRLQGEQFFSNEMRSNVADEKEKLPPKIRAMYCELQAFVGA